MYAGGTGIVYALCFHGDPEASGLAPVFTGTRLEGASLSVTGKMGTESELQKDDVNPVTGEYGKAG